MANKDWVTAKKLAEMLSTETFTVSQQTVQNWIKRGVIQHKKHEMFGITVVNAKTAPKVKETRGRRRTIADVRKGGKGLSKK
jgi:hypothetical protein